jgi:hypothetical protein
MATEKEVIRVLKFLFGAYPNAPNTPETTAVYCQMLADVYPDALLRAALEHIKREKWFPTISELRVGAHFQHKAEEQRKLLAQRMEERKALINGVDNERKLLDMVAKKSNLIPMRKSVKETLVTQKRYQIGADMSEEEWAEHIEAQKAKANG